MQIFKFKYLLPLLFVALFTASCAEDDASGSNGNITAADEATVTFNLMTSRGTLKPAVDDGELITSYMIVVADQNRKIVKVLTSENLPAAEMHTVTAKLTSGSYKLYAFANIPFSKLPVFTVNEALPSETYLKALYYGTDNTFCNGCAGPVPMSCKAEGQDIEILASKGNATYGIEVIRMLAKVEFVFKNSSSEDITISSISMGPLTAKGSTTTGFVSLFPYNDASALSFATGFATETYTHSLASPITIAKGASTQPTASFYVVESNPDPDTKAFNLAFNVKRGTETTEEVRYALLEKALVAEGTNLDNDNDRSPFIRRNDWIRIPIDLGDYEFRLEARSYPPIGGYPEVNVDEFKVNFAYRGYFTICPKLRKYGTTNWISLTDPVIDSYNISVDTTSPGLTNIFTATGSPVKKLNEIVGTIAPNAEGTAAVTLTVKIKISDSVTRTLTRKMYIKVQNNP